MNDVPGYEHIPGRYGVEVERTDSGTSTFVPLRPDLAAPDGSLRIAAVLMGIDMGAGITAGQAVLPGWTVTADIETHLVGGCTVGPLRVDARAIKPGRTMSVVDRHKYCGPRIPMLPCIAACKSLAMHAMPACCMRQDIPPMTPRLRHET